MQALISGKREGRKQGGGNEGRKGGRKKTVREEEKEERDSLYTGVGHQTFLLLLHMYL